MTTIMAFDAAIGLINMTMRLNAMLQKAAIEGRTDLTDEEVLSLKHINDALEQEVLNK